MDTTALIVFLASLGLGFLSLVVLVYSALRIYRTARYAYKDSQPWIALFKEYAENLTGAARIMEERIQGIGATGREIRENVDDIRDALEEMRSHPLLRTARFAARFRG
ncbi:MAG: hypothetical protein PHP28_08760 [Actinomycetota bacterium]|nr:hypothetical protein [Actinomycetota bacterium]MDD5668104.1 hypothetical protein [Actinomycetota bacterium]